MKLRKLTESDVTFTITAEPEDEPVYGQFASGDDDFDRKTAEHIFDELDRGNQWAWCCACVKAEWNGFEGTDYLGCCSYKSEADFKSNDYCADMKAAALDELNRVIEGYASRLAGLETE